MAQAVRAQGIVKVYPAIVNPIVDLFQKYNVNIIQMPCPELKYEGLIRKPAGKSHYDNEEYRKICREIAEEVVDSIKNLRKNGYEVVAILGMEYSPSCAVEYLWEGKLVKGMGVYMEELKKALEKNNIKIPFVGVNVYKIKSSLEKIEKLLQPKLEWFI